MTHKVVFRKKAIADLEDLYRFIRDREQNAERAFAYISRIRAYCEGFSQFPACGKQRDDICKGLGVVGFERRVLVVFEVSEDTVCIGRVLYGGRDYDRLLGSLPRRR